MSQEYAKGCGRIDSRVVLDWLFFSKCAAALLKSARRRSRRFYRQDRLGIFDLLSEFKTDAGVVQWQNGSFPSCIRGFDSLRPLQTPCNARISPLRSSY